ncbi:Uncharacterised protein [Vibrio cholerae]|nr:Uncharacterised protein [Vibrio cholerae]CSI67820.1 Uncharacterised protein [Vibrio cholerae]
MVVKTIDPTQYIAVGSQIQILTVFRQGEIAQLDRIERYREIAVFRPFGSIASIPS